MFNKAILVGRLTADPELRTTPSGTSVCTFSVACDRRFSGKDGERKADFINIVTWRQTAEFVSKYFTKGRPIGIEGSIQTRSYTDKEGNKRTAFEVVADNVFFVGSKSESGGSSFAAPSDSFSAAPVAYSSGSAGDFEEVEADSDLPF